MSLSSLAPATQSFAHTRDILLPSRSWGLAVLRQFPPRGLKEELLFDGISSKTLKRPFFDSSQWGSSGVCSQPAATTHSGAALCQGMVPSSPGRILSQKYTPGMGWGRQDQAPGLTPPPKTGTTSTCRHCRELPTPHRCWYHPTELAVPGAHGHGALLPSSAHPIPAELIPVQPHTEHTIQAINALITPSPANIPGAQSGTPAGGALGRGQPEGKEPCRRGNSHGTEELGESQSCPGQGQEGLSVPKCTSPTHTMNQNPRGAVKGRGPSRCPPGHPSGPQSSPW